MTRRFHWLRWIVATSFALLAFSLGSVALAANPERPYRGSCSTVILPLTPPGVFPQQLHIDSDCTVAHLGRTTGQATQSVTPTGQSGPVIALLIENKGTYTAANGDQLNITFLGTGLLNVETGDVTFIGVETFNGGTGRFAKASGNSQLEGTASIFTNRGFFTSKGRISY